MSDRVTQRIDDWIKAEIEGATSVNLPQIAAKGRDAFLADTEYLRALFSDQLQQMIYQRASKIFQTTRRGPVVLGDEVVDEAEFRRRSEHLATKWSNWLEHTGTAHVLLTSMNRIQLNAAAQEREERADAEALRAAFLRTLASRLTGVQTVGEVLSRAQIERIWVDVHTTRKEA